ncbi:MAG: carboxypeptidase regulatory-like domain-containing protein, partial [Chloracidobacterium sp.]|nr:carboxypeptidase regulatory-like domain-containing protein [Chloracidobacterium sp.]
MRSGKAGWILAANAMLAGLALGQDFRASISGTVSDSSGAPIAAAKVKVTNVEKKTESEATTNVTGLYSIQYLLPGHYTVEVEAQGFKRFVRENVDLNINDRFGLDVAMEVGALVESVRVTSQVPLLETESASRGGLVDPQFVENVPNRGRNMFELAFAMPGAYKPSTSQGNEFGIDAIGNATPQINGSAMGTSGRQWNTDVLINGTSNTQGNANLVMTPALAAIQELKVMTNTYDAAYGHTGGGIISVTTKSGSNDLHGQVFDRHFDSALAANSWANNRTGTPKSATSSDTYGFEVDGPILIPKVANLRN